MKAFVAICALALFCLFVQPLSVVRAQSQSIDLHARQASALEALRSAENDGANVTDLVYKYNSALSLLEQDGNYNDTACYSNYSCSQRVQAGDILDSVTSESTKLRDLAQESNQTKEIDLLITAAVFSVGIAFGITFLWSAWKKALRNQFLRMEVRRKDS